MIITADQLQRGMPALGMSASLCAGPINVAIERFQINTPRRAAEFLAQIAHESGQLKRLREDLDYTFGRLRAVWPKRFPTDSAAIAYAHQPEKLANLVYANLYGNGDVASGDGFRFRGAGYLQHTFRANHAAIGRQFGMPVEQVGDWLNTHEGAALGAAYYWAEHQCNKLADQGNTDAISDVINLGHRTVAVGDANGYQDRLAFRNRFYAVLGVA
jgi:putative chitinase